MLYNFLKLFEIFFNELRKLNISYGIIDNNDVNKIKVKIFIY